MNTDTPPQGALQATCTFSDQEHDHELPAESYGVSMGPDDQPAIMTQYVKALLEDGLFEKALSLACDCCHDPELSKDLVFLETALILFTNMGKSNEMWAEIKKLHSMDQLYPTAMALSQYYTPAALLTAEMLLCKELCEKTVTLHDLQQVTTLWVALLWSQLGHNKEAFESKVLHIGKLIVHEPTFVLNLVRTVHDKIGEVSLVLCVNLCLIAIQQPLEDPQSNLLGASHIDSNNAALCNQLAGLLAADTRLSRLCLLTTFTITPTKELFAKLDKAHKPSAVRIPSAPILPSCLSCILVHCMYSLLPSTISSQVEWRVLRGKCLSYLHSSSLINVKVKLPDQDVTVKMYVKEVAEDQGDKDEGTRAESEQELETGEGASEDTDQDECRRINTDSELQWLSTMLWLDMTWRPHWFAKEDQGHNKETPASIQPQINWHQGHKLFAAPVQACRDTVPLCNVGLVNLEDALKGHSNLSKASPDRHTVYQPEAKEAPNVQESPLDLDHSYSFPPQMQEASTQEVCQDLQGAHQPNMSEVHVIVLSGNEDSVCDEQMDWLDFVSAQHSDLSACESRRGPTMEEYEMQRPEAPGRQCNMDPGAINGNLERSASEVIGAEGQNHQSGDSLEGQDRQKAGSPECVVDLDFLQELKDDRKIPSSFLSQAICGSDMTCADSQPDEMSTEVDRWFYSIEQPSEASSIVGVDVTPDPLTEEGLQWSAIKSIASCQDRASDDQSLDALDLWLSEDDNSYETVGQKPPPSNASSGSLHRQSLDDDPKVEVPTLESTIERLEGKLSDLNKNLDPFDTRNISPQSIGQLSESTKQPEAWNFSSKAYSHSHTTVEPSFNQIQSGPQSSNHTLADGLVTTSNPDELEPEPTTLSPSSHESSEQPSLDLQTANQQTVNQSHTNHQTTNQPLNAGQVLKLKPQPPAICASKLQSSNKPTSEWSNQQSSFNQQFANQQQSAGQQSVTKRATTRRQSLNQESTKQRSARKRPLCKNGHAESKTSTTRHPLNAGLNNLMPDTEALAATSHRGCLCTTSTTETAGCVDDHSREEKEKSPVHHLILRNTAENPEALAVEQSNTSFLNSLLCAAVHEKVSQLSASNREEPNAKTRESQPEPIRTRDDSNPVTCNLPRRKIRKMLGIAESFEDPTMLPDVEHMIVPNAHVGSSLDCETCPGERSGKVLTIQGEQLTASAEEPETTEASKKVTSCRNQVTQGCSVKSMTAEGCSLNGEKDSKEAVGDADNTKDSFSDSDCSEFELVQDVSSSWSVSGKRATETRLPKKEKPLPQERTRALADVIKVESASPSGGMRKESLEVSENQLENGKSSSVKSSSVKSYMYTPLPKKVETHHPEIEGAGTPKGPNETQACTSPDGEERRQSPESESSSSEPIAKVGPASSLPARRYNLRAATSVNYVVAGSSTDAGVSSETSGEESGTKRTYSLRSTALCGAAKPSGILPKRPRKASKSPGSSTQKTSKAKRAPTGDALACTSKLTDSMQKTSTSPGSKHSATVLSNSNGVSDQNNNCSSSSSSSSISSRSAKSSGTKRWSLCPAGDKKNAASMPTKGRTATGPTAVVVDSSPPLPWETKPPLRTYSAKKNFSSL